MQHAQFDSEFFPTPRAIVHKMLAAITNKEATYFLEPSAGKGDIAEVIKPPGDERWHSTRREVDCIESSPELPERTGSDDPLKGKHDVGN